MTIVTNHELRKKFEEVQQQSQIGIRGISTPTNTGLDANNENTITITEKQINTVQNEYMVCADGTKAKLYSPLPGLKWRCTSPVGSQGIIALEKPLTGLILSDGVESYCLGVSGDTSEFELVLKVGSNEIRINDLFINLDTKLLVKNGLEQEEN
jgi:hypothetical protein